MNKNYIVTRVENINKWGGKPNTKAFTQPKGVDFGVLKIGDRVSWIDRLEGNQVKTGCVTKVIRDERLETIYIKSKEFKGLVVEGTIFGKPYDNVFKLQ